MTTRIDPIREKYYKPLEIAEKISGFLFYILASLSFATLVIERNESPLLHQTIALSFVVLVVTYFVINLISRYYLFPKAEDARRREFVSNVYEISLTHETTVGYYNNTEQNSNKRLIITLLENTFFSKNILALMLKRERVKIAIYITLFLVLITLRTTPLDLVIACSQVLLSEEILVRWVRMEWLKARAEDCYETCYRIIHSDVRGKTLQALGTEWFGKYESGKTLAGVVQSEVVFNRVNDRLSQEWEVIKQTLEVN